MGRPWKGMTRMMEIGQPQTRKQESHGGKSNPYEPLCYRVFGFQPSKGPFQLKTKVNLGVLPACIAG